MSKYLKYLCAIGFLLITLRSFSQVIITDRPDQTESAVSVPKGVFQLESGMALEINAAERNWTFNNSLFRYGLAGNLELRLVSELQNRYRVLSEADGILGMGDIEMGIKFQFLSGNLKAAYLGHVVLPTGTRDISGGKLGMSHRIAISREVGGWLTVSCNLGIGYFRSEDPDGIYSLSFGFPITDRIGFYTEVYGEWSGFENLQVLYDHGLTYQFAPNLQFDFSMGTGISSKSNYWAIGISWYAPYQD